MSVIVLRAEQVKLCNCAYCAVELTGLSTAAVVGRSEAVVAVGDEKIVLPPTVAGRTPEGRPVCKQCSARLLADAATTRGVYFGFTTGGGVRVVRKDVADNK